MEFWAVEVKSGEPLKVQPPEGMLLHLSQASLGDNKKANESVPLFLNVDGKKLVLATLVSEKLPQQQLDLVFDKELELSHNWKSGSVYFYGYIAKNPFEDEDDDDDLSSDDDDIPLTLPENGSAVTKANEEKPADASKANAGKDTGAGKQKVRIVEPTPKAEEDNESSEDSEEDDSMSDEESDDSDSEDDESDDSEEETPKKAEASKKRGGDSDLKTPGREKKAKLSTPQKTDGKKAPHVATPYPSKQAGKSAANKNQQTPKSVGSHSCKSCNKTFNSENALESHTKAKHSAAKSGK